VEQTLRQVSQEHATTAAKRGLLAHERGTGLAEKHSRHMESEAHAELAEAHASRPQLRHMGEMLTPPPSGGGAPVHRLEVQAQGEAPQEAPVGPLAVPR
jgi:hypothetical protein